MRILFVCTGNTCRSCLAETIFKNMVKQEGLSAEVKSAGIGAIPGLDAASLAVEVAKEAGINLGEHKTRSFNRELAEWADLILTLDETHKNFILTTMPEMTKKIFTLKEYEGNKKPSFYFVDLSIADPIGGSKEDYEECFREIKEELEKLLAAIKLRKQEVN